MRSSGVWRNRLLRYWAYFRRGYGVYLAFAISFINSVAIQYYLLIQEVPFLQVLFKNLYIFIIVFLVTYIPLATIIGWVDYKRGSVPVDTAIGARASPYAKDMARAIILLAEGKNEEVVKLMKKWAKE